MNPAGPFWYGGPAVVDLVLRGGIDITTDRRLAEMNASTCDGTAWIYQLEPHGDLERVAPGEGVPIVYRCASARIVRRYTISAERRQRLLKAKR